jgi:hypothetical protein
MDHPRPGLKFVPDSELDQRGTKLQNFAVEDPDGEKLGTLEGFIVDVNRADPYYLVVKAGSWFRSKHVLIPIGHVALDTESRRLVADVPKERVKRFPGFHLDLFPRLTQDDLERMAEEIGRVCCPDHVVEPVAVVSVFEWEHYRTPSWWNDHAGEGGSAERTPESVTGTRRP